jgi:hypothetical protein
MAQVEMPSTSLDLALLERMEKDDLIQLIVSLYGLAEHQQNGRLGSPYDPKYIYTANTTGKRCQGCGAVVTEGQDIGWAPASKNIWHLGCVEKGLTLEDRRGESRHLIVM